MEKVKVKIVNPTGLHTRPGTEFVRLAKSFESEITIEKNGVVVNAKSIVKVLKLGISQNIEVTLSAQGDDEKSAIDSLTTFIESLKD